MSWRRMSPEWMNRRRRSERDEQLGARPPGRLLRTVRRGVSALAGLLWPTSIEGGRHVAREGPAIIAANHIYFFDSIALNLAVGRPIGFVGKAEYLDSWKTRRLFPALGM